MNADAPKSAEAGHIAFQIVFLRAVATVALAIALGAQEVSRDV
jgi:hypothetical protein